MGSGRNAKDAGTELQPREQLPDTGAAADHGAADSTATAAANDDSDLLRGGFVPFTR